MKRTISTLVLLAGLALPLMSAQAEARQDRKDTQLLSQVTQQLQKKDVFQSVTARVDDGIVTLNGDVPLYIDKLNAEKRVRKVSDVDGVRNHIRIGGQTVSDGELSEKLGNKLRYDRIGYGIVFNSLGLNVDHGVVTVNGTVRDYADRDSALAIVSTTAGVKDVVDEISVAPTSTFDDDLRIRLARAIYGNSALHMYAIDPQAPIRIVVANGHVELAGVVQNNADRQIAFSAANTVPGVFSVTNHLNVASQVNE